MQFYLKTQAKRRHEKQLTLFFNHPSTFRQELLVRKKLHRKVKGLFYSIEFSEPKKVKDSVGNTIFSEEVLSSNKTSNKFEFSIELLID